MREAMGSTAHRTSETNLRRCGGTASRASQKGSLLYEYYDGRDVGPQRSVSLTTLSPTGAVAVPVVAVQSPASPGSVSNGGDTILGPRMAQLETLEARMASIEVSLSTTPRRKKNGSIGSAAGVTAAAAVVAGVTAVGPTTGVGTPVPPHRPASNRDVVRELDALRNAMRDKENLIQSLRNQLSGTPPAAAPTPTSAPSWPASFLQRPPPSDKERRAAEERLSKLRQDVDNKRLAIKNLKMALERLDITDNIDVRIQQAELEYQLGREELNLLSLLEESRNVAALLDEADRARASQAANTLHSCVGASGRALLVSVQLTYDPKSPQFGAGPREDAPGLYVHWATDSCGMAKGDRVLEVNGKLVLGKGRDEMQRLLAVSPDPALLVVLRAAPDRPERHDRDAGSDAAVASMAAQLAAERERAQAAERAADGLRADGVRLSHRISYLEDQVSELLARADAGLSSPAMGTALPQRSASANVSTVIVTAPSASPQDVQLFQKGPQVQLVSNLPRLEAGSPSLAALRSKRDVSHNQQDTGPGPGSGSETPAADRTQRTDRQGVVRSERSERRRHSGANSALGPSSLGLARSTNSLDVFSAESPRGPVQHIRIRQSPGSQTDGLASDSDLRRPRRKSEAPDGRADGRHYRKHHEYCSSGGEGRPSRPVPPRKPLRLSLHRAASLQSVESAPPAPSVPPSPHQGHQAKAPKRNHKGEAPGLPSDAAHPHPFQSALRWATPAAAGLQQIAFRQARSSGNLSTGGLSQGLAEKWC